MSKREKELPETIQKSLQPALLARVQSTLQELREKYPSVSYEVLGDEVVVSFGKPESVMFGMEIARYPLSRFEPPTIN